MINCQGFLKVLLCLLVVVTGETASEGGETNLLNILQHRSRTIVGFQADVRVDGQNGSEREQLYQEMLAHADWIEKNGVKDREKRAKRMRNNAEMTRMIPVLTPANYRYYAIPPNLIRIEQYRWAEGQIDRKDPVVNIFTGDRWTDFAPASRVEGDGPHQNQLLIHKNAPPGQCNFEIMRGDAVPTDFFMQLSEKATTRSLILAQTSWKDLTNVIVPESIQESRRALPDGGPVLPMLSVGIKREGKGCRFRIQVWLQPDKGYHPVRLECADGLIDPRTKNYYYVPSRVCVWSDFQKINNVVVATKCNTREYHLSYPVVQGKPSDEWPGRSFETYQNTAVFSNVKVNDLIPESLFKPIVPPDTNVVDEVANTHYLVGSSGEVLRKSALALNPPPPIAPNPDLDMERNSGVAPRTIKMVLIVNMFVFLFIIVLITWYRRRFRKERTL